MNDVELGLIVRAIRRRLMMRQADVARRAGVHRSTVDLLERGGAGGLALDVLRRILGALEARLEVRPFWRGPHLDRLLDEHHARLAAAWKARLERWGWLVRAEVSYSRYGERGRNDLFIWHPRLRIVGVIEIKTDMVDSQDLLGPMDVKTRLAPVIAAGLGWRDPAMVVPIVLFKDDRTVRRRVARLAPLFSQFDVVGRAATAWLRKPSLEPMPHGLLIFSDLSYGGVKSLGPVGRERVAVKRRALSVESAAEVDAPEPRAVER
jgi:transcriptional regulator with XRE-family HTH domain